ncbi:MAG TPA: glycosyltransferase family 2 protein [Mucilaginibacter sp.]|nr:glycosyltransferase family 2 protein [Mucilaginibacter sp.]
MPLSGNFPASDSKKGWPWDEEVTRSVYQGDSQWPKISIITPSFNQGQYIEETIRSILLQNYPNLEYIIIDGGSTDNTLEIIAKYSPWISYWISEKDNGQAGAINKGLTQSTGDIVNWINSDDYLTAGALLNIANQFKGGLDLLAGCVNNFNEVAPEISDGYTGVITNKNLSLLAYFCNGGFYYHQPGVWFNRNLFINLRLNESMHYCFDTELLLRILAESPNIEYTNDMLANFRLHGQSKTVSSNKKFMAEFRQIHLRYTQNADPVISAFAQQLIDRKAWADLLLDLQAAPISKLKKTLSILKGITDDPFHRLNRFSLGALKRVILG